MAKLVWDAPEDRRFETGVDQGILFLTDTDPYDTGFAWNGLTTVTESPAGAESNPQYADNIIYLNLLSAETFGGTIEAYTYPDAFAECDGSVAYGDGAGVIINQQTRKSFGLAYRTKLGTADDVDAGYKWHLVYGCLASPSEKAYATVNDSPDPLTFSWDFSTVPASVPGFKPTSLIVVDSTKVTGPHLTAFETILMGGVAAEPRLPLPAEMLTLFGA